MLRMVIIPTLAPYLVPKFIKIFSEKYPKIELRISEMRTQTLIGALGKGEIDMMIAATPLNQPDFYEIPLYYEPFAAYFSQDNSLKDVPLSANSMPSENLWILQEGHCLRNQTFNFCRNFDSYNKNFEAGSIDTLIRIVDNNGGYSVIPELHIPFLTEEQKKNVRKIENPPAVREVSLVIRKDFIKERILNAVADTIKEIIPEEMLDRKSVV